MSVFKRNGLTVVVIAALIFGGVIPTAFAQQYMDTPSEAEACAGAYYRQMKKGKLISFKVMDLLPHTVLADFNDPLAGIEVSMELEVTAIREASREEVEAAGEAQVKRRIGCA